MGRSSSDWARLEDSPLADGPLSLQNSYFIKVVHVPPPEEEPSDMGSNESLVSHTIEGQERPEVSVATWGSGDPGPVDGQPGTPLRKRPRFPRTVPPRQLGFNQQLKVFTSDVDYTDHVNQTGPEHPEPKEAVFKGEKLGK